MQLVIKKADGSQQSVPLSPDKPLKLGSDPSADIVIAAAGVQKVHCGFLHKDGKFHVVATKASQQVEVNGRAVPSAALAAGHTIKLPGAQITVQDDQPAAADDFGLLPIDGEAAAPAPSLKPVDDEFGLAPLEGQAPKPTKPAQPAAGGLQPLEPAGLAPLDDAPALKPVDDPPALKPVDDEFGLAPIDGSAKAPAPKKKPAPAGGLQPLDEGGLQPLEEAPGLTPLQESPKQQAGGLQPLEESPASGGLAPLDELPASGGLAPLDELPASGGLAPLDDLGGGGLDELSSDALGEPLGADALAAAPPPKPKQPSAAALFLKSPAFKALAMGVAALAALGLALLIAFTLPTADSRFETADASYRGREYDRAIEDFTGFLSWHASDPRAGEARAKRGLSKLRPLADKKDWSGLVTRTKEVIGEVGGDARHEEFRRQLAAMLPQAVTNLTDRAEANLRNQREVAKAALTEAQNAMALVKKYVPPQHAAEQGMPQAQVRLVQLARDLARDESLASALAEIKQAVDGGEPDGAYRVRRELLLKYPQLSSGLQLQTAMEGVAAAERSRVKNEPANVQVTTDEPKSRISKTLVPLAWSGANDGSQTDASEVVCLSSPATGAVYAFDASSGGLLWRRYVGTGLPARPHLVGEPAAGVIVVDPLAAAVQRLELATGKLVWQSAVPNLCGSVTVTEDEVLVPTFDGTLVRININTGAGVGQFRFPQPLSCAPVVDPLNRTVLQLAEHSNLYVLTADNLCDAVAYVGHETAGVALAPVMLDRFLLVFENGLSETTIRVFQRRELKQVQSITLDALVAVDPLVTDGALYLSTANGTVYAFELDTAKPTQPLVAFPPIDSGARRSAGVALAGDRLWVAGRGLRVFDLPLDRKQPEPKEVLYPDSHFAGAPQVDGKVVISARHDPQAAGMVVVGTSADDESRIWRTQIAPPGALVASADGARLWLLHAGGALFELSADQLAAAAPNVLSKPTASVEVRGPLSLGSGLSWEDGQAVLAPGDYPGLFVAGTGDEKLRVRSLPGALAAPPTRVGNQLLIATGGGPIFLIDPASDSTPGVPFLPRIEAGKLPQWRGPAVIGGSTVLVSDGHTRIYKLAITGPGKLEQQLAVDTPDAIETPLAAAGKLAWGVNAQGALVAYDSELRSAANVALDAPVAFGPVSLGNRAIVATADGRLFGLGEEPNPLWEVPLPHGAIVGAVGHKDRLILASRSGVIFGLHPDSGQPTGSSVETGQPLGGSPVVMGNHLIVPGSDGSLHVISDIITLLLSGAPATAAR